MSACQMDAALQRPSSQNALTQPPGLDRVPSLQKPGENHHEPSSIGTTTSTGSSVTCIYQAMLIGSFRNIAITWSSSSDLHTLAITIENLYDEDHQTCQIDFQSWQFWSRKGLKSLQVDDERVEIYWDLRAVKFSPSNPEPCSNYYVAIVFDKEIVFLLGDNKAEAIKRTMSRPSLIPPSMLHKEEILCGKNCFRTRLMLNDGPKEHDIVIENSMLRPGEPELRISIDGRVVVRVMNLNWRFRGNETVLVSSVLVQVFWDVHDWLFSNPGSGHGLFIFKPGSLKDGLDDGDQGNRGSRGGHNGKGDSADEESPSTGGCCHFVFAVKVV